MNVARINSVLPPLYLFDYDGVWVQIQKESFSLMRQAIAETLSKHSQIHPSKLDTLQWNSIFDKTKGSTEHTFVSTVFNDLDIPTHARDPLFVQFIQERANLIADYNIKHGLRKFDENHVYLDTQELVRTLKDRFPTALFGLVTGNPLWVVEQRLPLELQNVFDIRIGGEYGNTRKDMLNLALVHAKKLGWKGWKDKSGMFVNAFYVDDAKAGVLSALEGGFKTVFLDRPPNVDLTSFKTDSMRNDKFQDDLEVVFGKAKTHRLMYGEYDRSMQSVFTTDSLANMWLLEPMEGTGVYAGWLQPEAHAQWKIHTDENEVMRIRKEG